MQRCADSLLTLREDTTRLSVGSQITSNPVSHSNTIRTLEQKWRAIPERCYKNNEYVFDSLVHRLYQ